MANKKSLKIERKKNKAKKVPKIRLTIKVKKVDRTAKKIKTQIKKSLKSAIKGAKIKKIPERLYRKIDAAIANAVDIKTIIDAAVVKIVNDNLIPKNVKKKVIE